MTSRPIVRAIAGRRGRDLARVVRLGGDLIGPIGGLGVFVLLGALGARLAWRIFRNTDPRDPPPSALPQARLD